MAERTRDQLAKEAQWYEQREMWEEAAAAWRAAAELCLTDVKQILYEAQAEHCLKMARKSSPLV